MQKSRRLIINADGYGFTPGVNRGIVETFEAGLVRSTSCTPNFGFLGELGTLAKRFPHVSFGLHVNLSVGTPLSDPRTIPSLVNEDGKFHGRNLLNQVLARQVRYEDIVRELTAQCAIVSDMGIRISHIDGHQNKHLYPLYFSGVLEVARKFNIKGMRTHRRLLYLYEGPITFGQSIRYYATHPTQMLTHIGGRIRTRQARSAGMTLCDRLITPGYADGSHKSLLDHWITLARTLPAGTSEIYCHPGYVDDILRENAKYTDEREKEIEILTSPKVIEAFRESHIELINFHDLAVGE